MAYINQERKKTFQPAIKALLKEHGMKGSLAVQNYSTIVLNLREGIIDFGTNDARVNHYYIKDHYDGVAREFLTKAVKILWKENHDNSDSMTDYFDVGWYININIGKWDKPYKLNS